MSCTQEGKCSQTAKNQYGKYCTIFDLCSFMAENSRPYQSQKKKEKKRKKHTVADFPFDEEVTKLECLQTL